MQLYKRKSWPTSRRQIISLKMLTKLFELLECCNQVQKRVPEKDCPNSLWRMKSYDKLRPYSICIGGYIDGFFRDIIWLNAGIKSNGSRFICAFIWRQHLHLIVVHKLLEQIRLGAENGINLFAGKWGTKRFNLLPLLYGPSPANQKTESSMATLTKHRSQFWINPLRITGCSLELFQVLLQYAFTSDRSYKSVH